MSGSPEVGKVNELTGYGNARSVGNDVAFVIETVAHLSDNPAITPEVRKRLLLGAKVVRLAHESTIINAAIALRDEGNGEGEQAKVQGT